MQLSSSDWQGGGKGGSLTLRRQECNGKHGVRGNLTVSADSLQWMSTARNLFHRPIYENPTEICNRMFAAGWVSEGKEGQVRKWHEIDHKNKILNKNNIYT